MTYIWHRLERIWVTVEALFPIVNGIFGNRWSAYLLLLGNQTAYAMCPALPTKFCTYRYNTKNYLFCGADSGGHRAAAIYSLVGAAKLNGLDPELYLRQVLTSIPEHPISRIDELLPWKTVLADAPPPTSPAEVST
jgi:hypothetical protein